MTVNSIQHGGSHYRGSGDGSFQHWDYTIHLRLGYLESAATKYVLRWREKGGRIDLDKAHHYLQKLYEHRDQLIPLRLAALQVSQFTPQHVSFAMSKLREAFVMDDYQDDILYLIGGWSTDQDLLKAILILRRYMIHQDDVLAQET